MNTHLPTPHHSKYYRTKFKIKSIKLLEKRQINIKTTTSSRACSVPTFHVCKFKNEKCNKINNIL